MNTNTHHLPNKKLKVLFITGRGRSGSTFLDLLMGQIEGFFSTGQLRALGRIRSSQNRLCGCGVPIEKCRLWQQILGACLSVNPQSVSLVNVARAFKDTPGKLHIPLFLLPGARLLTKYLYKNYLKNMKNLYSSISRISGCDVIIDSSKFPPYGFLVGDLPSIDLYVLHLVRDPRAVVHSWSKKQFRINETESSGYMKRENIFYSSSLWLITNYMAEKFWGVKKNRYMLLRYEDFCTNPIQEFERILFFLNENHYNLPFIDGRHVFFKPTHAVSGNPRSLIFGPIEIRANENWKHEMKGFNKKLITSLTWPLLNKYGYTV